MKSYSDVREQADRVHKMVVERARYTASQAGLSPLYPFMHAHNAMVSLEHGEPWDVDYSLVRKVLFLEKLS